MSVPLLHRVSGIEIEKINFVVESCDRKDVRGAKLAGSNNTRPTDKVTFYTLWFKSIQSDEPVKARCDEISSCCFLPYDHRGDFRAMYFIELRHSKFIDIFEL
jgi:hypothetical protein